MRVTKWERVGGLSSRPGPFQRARMDSDHHPDQTRCGRLTMASALETDAVAQHFTRFEYATSHIRPIGGLRCAKQRVQRVAHAPLVASMPCLVLIQL